MDDRSASRSNLFKLSLLVVFVFGIVISKATMTLPQACLISVTLISLRSTSLAATSAKNSSLAWSSMSGAAFNKMHSCSLSSFIARTSANRL